jgi:hypothetical protein
MQYLGCDTILLENSILLKLLVLEIKHQSIFIILVFKFSVMQSRKIQFYECFMMVKRESTHEDKHILD